MIRCSHHDQRRLERKPRASGDDPSFCAATVTSPSVNPARAGMIPEFAVGGSLFGGKPRASGDDP